VRLDILLRFSPAFDSPITWKALQRRHNSRAGRVSELTANVRFGMTNELENRLLLPTTLSVFNC
jgi:hypothetical protein